MKLLRSSLPDFRKRFATKHDCEEYLIQLKWPKGYHCHRCGHKCYGRGAMQMHRRCKNCDYNESPTANTVFHSIKIPLPIAFEMVYRISVSKKGISALALSREYNLNPKTGYNFKQKIQKSMSSSQTNPLEGVVHVDEFEIGGPEENAQGRKRDSSKKKVVLAVEIIKCKDKLKMGRAYAQVIKNYSSKEIEKIFKSHISVDAMVKSDGWSGYKPIKSEYNIEQIISNKGKSFPNIHILIMNIKSWIRGIHQSVSAKHVQKYLDEFIFRFNRRNTLPNLPDILMRRVQSSTPKPVTLSIRGNYG